jgi:DNA transformation protein and related proteins
MSSKVSSLKNLGPISESMLAQVGIVTAEELKRQDPVDVYVLLKLFGFDVNRNMLWALYGAINDCDFRNLPEKVKTKLEAQLKDVENSK